MKNALNLKNISMTIGVAFILLALLTIIPNSIVGRDAIFYTDLSHNLIHFFIGAAILVVAFEYERYISKTFRVLGIIYLALAVLGAIGVGFEPYGHLFGFIGMNGADNILHLVFGVLMIVIGTKDIRMPPDDIVEDDITEEYNPLTH